MPKYQLAALGGTFDHFHQGHQTLLKHAINLADKVIIGITADTFILEKEFPDLIQTYEQRCQAVQEYMSSLGREKDITLVKLDNIYGPTLIDPKIDCLVVSPLTEGGAQLINQKRVELNLKKLPVEICFLELSSDKQAISSTRIRKGEINHNGFVYYQLLKQEIKLNSKQISALKKPFGKVIKNISQLKQDLRSKSLIVSVGDTATRICLENNIPITFGVFDNLEQRLPISQTPIGLLISKPSIKVANPPGIITTSLTQGLIKGIHTNTYVEVNGEEDLAVIPLTLLLTLESVILYGQPNDGIVQVIVSEEKKEWIKKLINK